MTMGGLADYLLSAQGPAESKVLLSRLFERRRNRFSHQFAEVADTDGAIAGIAVSYPPVTSIQSGGFAA